MTYLEAVLILYVALIRQNMLCGTRYLNKNDKLGKYLLEDHLSLGRKSSCTPYFLKGFFRRYIGLSDIGLSFRYK